MYRRSEGLAVASLEMFKTGAFSSDPVLLHRVDKAGLKKFTLKSLESGMQISEDNPMAGLEGRASLLMKLSDAMENTALFGRDGRPGNMIGKESDDVFRAASLSTTRLFIVASLDPGGICSDRPPSNSLVGFDGWIGTNLAIYSNSDKWRLHWRCLALLHHARISSRSAMGEHCSLSQADSMALLFPHGTHD